jgi:CRP-like cAMP-binding protein
MKQSPLFHGVEENDMEAMLGCLGATERKYGKNDVIMLAGTKVTSVGVLIEGSAQITRDDADGNRAILSELEKADLFAEAYVAAGSLEVPITVVATSDCRILWIPFNKIVGVCSSACGFHKQLVQNMLRVIAQKNILMNEKMRICPVKPPRKN